MTRRRRLTTTNDEADALLEPLLEQPLGSIGSIVGSVLGVPELGETLGKVGDNLLFGLIPDDTPGFT